MAWGLLLGGRRYDAVDYSCALTVTLGCGLFVLTGSIAAPQQLRSAAEAAAASVSAAVAGATSAGAGDVGAVAAAIQGALPEAPSPRWVMYGLALLAAFLVFDGLTSTAQDRLFAQHEMHSCTQLLWVSLWSAALRWVCLESPPAAAASAGAAAAGADFRQASMQLRGAACAASHPPACLFTRLPAA